MARSKKVNRRKGDSIVQNYGLYWQKQYVDWRVAGHMYGKTKSNPKIYSDFWDQVGVYILYDRNDQPVYFGQVGVITRTEEGEGNTLGKRLRAHAFGDFGDQWVRFSWFGVKQFNKSRPKHSLALKNGKRMPLKVLGKEKPIGKLKQEIALIEALLISVLRKGGLNKQEGHWTKIGATRFYQVELPALRAENDEDYRLLTEILNLLGTR